MSNTAVEKADAKAMEYIPFGAQDKIKLSVAIVKNLICVPTKSGAVCSDNDAIKFMMMCQAKRLNPFEGDAFLIGYDSRDKGPVFSLITAHQAFLKRAEASADFDGMTSGILIRKDDDSIEEREGDFHLAQEEVNVVGGWARVFHKKRNHPTYRRLRMARFNKGFAQWNEDAAGMIVKCAEADALRSTFPTLLGGLYMREEVLHTVDTDKKTTTPIFATPSGQAQLGAVVEAEEVTEAPKETKPAAKPEPKAAVKPTSPSALARGIRAGLKGQGITEAALVAFAEGMGICDKSCRTLEDIHSQSDDALTTIDTEFADIVRRIKENQAAEEGGEK